MNPVEYVMSVAVSQALMAAAWIAMSYRFMRGGRAAIIIFAGAVVPLMTTIAVGYAWLSFLPVTEQGGSGMLFAMTVWLAFLLFPLSFIVSISTWYAIRSWRPSVS